MNTNQHQRVANLVFPSSPTSIASVMSFQTPSSSEREKSPESTGAANTLSKTLGDDHSIAMATATASTNMSIVSEAQHMSSAQGSSDYNMSSSLAMMSFLEEDTPSSPNTKADSLPDQTMTHVSNEELCSSAPLSPVNVPQDAIRPERSSKNINHPDTSAAVAAPRTPKSKNRASLYPTISEFPPDLESDRIYKSDERGLVMPLRSPSVKEPIYPEASEEEEPLEAECVDECRSLSQLMAPTSEVLLLSQDDLTAVSTISGTITRKEEVFKLRALLDEVLNAQEQDQPPTMPPRRRNMMHPGASPPLSLASDIRSMQSMDSHDCSTLGKTLPRPSRLASSKNPNLVLPPQNDRDSLLGSFSQTLMPSNPPPLSSRENRVANSSLSQQMPARSSKSGFPPRNPDPSPLSTQQQQVQIEVTPGHSAPVRSSQETIQALERGYAEVLSCMVCENALAVVADCQYVLCPDCRVVFPMTLDTGSARPPHGVGLALRL